MAISSKIIKLRRFVFIMGLSIPFNNLAITLGRNWSVGFICSILYFLVMIPYVNNIGSLTRRYDKRIWFPLFFLILLVFANLINMTGYNTPIIRSSYIFCFILFCLLLLHAQLDRHALQYALDGFVLGCLTIAICFNFNIGVKLDDGLRLVIFGENSNAIGIYQCIGSIILLNEYILKDRLNWGRKRYIFSIGYIPMVSTLLATASRTAFFIFLLSMVMGLLLFKSRNKMSKVVLIIVGALGLVIGVDRLMNSDSVLSARLLETKEEGNMSQRDIIWASLVPYVLDNPIIGYGETGYVDVSMKALGKIYSSTDDGVYGYSPHNVILELLLYTGVIGLVIYLVFWFWLYKCACISRTRNQESLPLLLLLPVLASVLSGQILYAKWAFLVYAYVISSCYYPSNSIVQDNEKSFIDN